MDKSERLNIESYMVTIDTQKAFHYTFFFYKKTIFLPEPQFS